MSLFQPLTTSSTATISYKESTLIFSDTVPKVPEPVPLTRSPTKISFAELIFKILFLVSQLETFPYLVSSKLVTSTCSSIENSFFLRIGSNTGNSSKGITLPADFVVTYVPGFEMSESNL